MGFNQGLGHQKEMRKIESAIKDTSEVKALKGDKLRQFNLLEDARGKRWYPLRLARLRNGTL